MKIGILLTGHAPDALIGTTGDYDSMFRDLLGPEQFEYATYAVVDGEFPDGPGDADGWLITGSRHGVYEDHDWIEPLEDLIRAIKARNQPLIGICFGHQIVAQALGGKVEKFGGGWAVGRTEYDFDGRPVVLNAWHQDQVVKRPEEARVLASNPFCENAVLAYGDSILTIQPHPEYDSDFIGGLIRTRGRGLVPDEILDAAEQRLEGPTDRDGIATWMAEFFRKEKA